MEQQESTPSPITTGANHDYNKTSNTGWKVATTVASILAICGIGFGIYGIINTINNGSNSSQTEQNTTESTTQTGLGAYATIDLKNKTLRLLGHHGDSFKIPNTNSASDTFAIIVNYMPINQLIANELTDSLKTYIMLETTTMNDETCFYQHNQGVKSDIDSIVGQTVLNFESSVRPIDCISYDKASNDYQGLWGESLQKLNEFQGPNIGHDFAYGPNQDMYYYHIAGGRGGATFTYVVGEISQVEKSKDGANVGIKAATLKGGVDVDTTLYSDIEGNTIYRAIGAGEYDVDNLNLTSSDYDSFSTYRFVFKENPNGIYSFVNVEKI